MGAHSSKLKNAAAAFSTIILGIFAGLTMGAAAFTLLHPPLSPDGSRHGDSELTREQKLAVLASLSGGAPYGRGDGTSLVVGASTSSIAGDDANNDEKLRILNAIR